MFFVVAAISYLPLPADSLYRLGLPLDVVYLSVCLFVGDLTPNSFRLLYAIHDF